MLIAGVGSIEAIYNNIITFTKSIMLIHSSPSFFGSNVINMK